MLKQKNILLLIFCYFIYASHQETEQKMLPYYYLEKLINLSAYYSILKIQANSHYLTRLSNINVVNVGNSTTYSYLGNLSSFSTLMSNYQTNSSYSPSIRDFVLTDDHHIAVLTDKYFLTQNLSTTVLKYNIAFSGVQTGKSIEICQNFIFVLTNQNKLFVYNQNKQNNSLVQFIHTFTQFNQSSLRMTACQNINVEAYVTIWDGYFRVVILKCPYGSACIKYNQFQPSSTTFSWRTDKIKFDKQCKFFIVQQDSVSTIKIWDINNNILYKQLFQPAQTIVWTQFYDLSGDHILIYCQNNSILVYNIQNKPVYVGKIQLNVTLSNMVAFDIYKNKIFMESNGGMHGFITKCGSNYFMNSNNICQKLRQTSIIFGLFNSSVIDRISQVVFTPLFNTSGYILFFAQIMPLSIFFIRFINFWNICSLYALVQTDMPEFLEDILRNIYQAVNFSIFSVLNIDFDLKLGVENRLQTTYLNNYGINSDFLQMHTEDFVIYIICFTIILLICMFKNLVNKTKLMSKKLEYWTSYIIATQFLASSFTYTLTSKILILNKDTQNYKQKCNMLLHITMIFTSLVFPFLIIAPNNCLSDKKHPSSKTNSKKIFESHYQEQQKRWQIFYNSLSTNYISFVIIMECSYLTFLVGLIIFCYGFKLAKRSIRFRLNKIVLSLYLLLFHMSFYLMIFFGGNLIKIQYLKSFFAFFCTVFILIGAVHETFSMIFQIGYNLWRFLKSRAVVSPIQYCNHQLLNQNSQLDRFPIKNIKIQNIKLQNPFSLKFHFINKNKKQKIRPKRLIFINNQIAEVNVQAGQTLNSQQKYQRRPAIRKKNYLFVRKNIKQKSNTLSKIEGKYLKKNVLDFVKNLREQQFEEIQ